MATQTNRPNPKQSKDSAMINNEHNKKEHEAKLAREAAEKDYVGQDGMNEHNRKEHEERLAREAAKNS